jgi:lipopolysaccharide transport system ATP-binding protein
MHKVIKVEGLSKAYQLGDFGTGTISRDLERFWARARGKEDPFIKIGEVNDRTSKGGSDVVWSLKDVNFDIKQGDAVGIIGRNGAGKSTLLKILSRITAPTTGVVKIKGRIASLLEVGTGFHPELTGRENIYLNGAILGMRKKEIKRKFDEILDFAGVERYIDTPVKRYSSGMYVRLAFAVAAHLESEILIVDEVLAVGDAEFQKKCLGKMNDISKGEGRTVLFVSHNITAIRELCNTGLLLDNGIVTLNSNIVNIISKYSEKPINGIQWNGSDGFEGITIVNSYIKVHNSDTAIFYTNQLFEIGIKIILETDLNEIGIGLVISSSENYPLIRLFFNDYNKQQRLNKGSYLIKFCIPPYHLASGSYKVNFDVSLPGIVKVNSEKSDLSFSLIARDVSGNRYFAENAMTFNSIVRPDWFHEITSL